ncbi:MAG: four helix bundle protein [Bacteroidetes bacterium]|nr:four helix bundle protein [Bacteroidota bacterium]
MDAMRIEIENRLINLSVSIINLCRNLNQEFVSEHLSAQIIRSSTSSALNYGEAQGAESRKDFAHKVSIVLKELRETQISLKIIKQAQLNKKAKFNDDLIKECGELIAIFHKTIITTRTKKP